MTAEPYEYSSTCRVPDCEAQVYPRSRLLRDRLLCDRHGAMVRPPDAARLELLSRDGPQAWTPLLASILDQLGRGRLTK